MDKPSKHFAINYHIAKELANELKAKKVYRVAMSDEKMALRLRFYDILEGKRYNLSTKKPDGAYEQIDIAYSGVVVKIFYLYEMG